MVTHVWFTEGFDTMDLKDAKSLLDELGDDIDSRLPVLWNQEMPTALRVGPYRFFFYSGDRNELPHVHVERDDKTAKSWLEPIRLESNRGFSRAELGEFNDS